MSQQTYNSLKEKISSAISEKEAYSYENRIDMALKNFMLTEDEANKLYDLMESVAMYFQDLYTTTPRSVGDKDPIKEWKEKHPGKLTFKEWLKENYNLDIITYSEKSEGYKRRIVSAFDYYLHPENYEEVEMKDSAIDLEKQLRKILNKSNGSKIHLFETTQHNEDFVERFDDGPVDFNNLKTYERTTEELEKGYSVASFMITGGKNGNGEWEDYLKDLEDLFKEIKKETGMDPILYKVHTDISDDVWTGEVFLYSKANKTIQDSLTLFKDSFKINDIIKETSEGYIIYSEKGKRLSKAFKTRKEAEERLKEIEMFKHMKKDALEKPELYGKKVKIVVNNALSNTVDRMFGQDVISRKVNNKNEIEYVLPYDGRLEYFLKRFHKKFEVMDSYYKGFGIEQKGDVYQVWKYYTDGRKDEKVGGDFSTEDEAREFIENQQFVSNQPTNVKKIKKPIPTLKPKKQKYMIEFVRNGDEPMTEIYYAKNEGDAIKQLIRNYKGEELSEIRTPEVIQDNKKEIKDMFDEVKKFLSSLIVNKDDPDNKLGKTYVRNLRNNERLPRGVYFKAATDTSGIIHFKGSNYYWYLDNEDELHIAKVVQDSLSNRFICESYFDSKYKGLEDRKETNNLDKAKDWVLDKANVGYFTRVIDKTTGEVWTFGELDDPFELDKIKPYESTKKDDEDGEIISPEEVHLWIVKWYDPKGNKHTIEFDSLEDANEYMDEMEDDIHINMTIEEKDRFVADSVKVISKEKIEAQLRKILTDYLLEEGYDKDDIDEWLVIRIRNYTNYEGDKGIEIEIANEFVDYYDLPEDVMKALDKVVDPAYFEPYSATIWQAYLWDNVKLEDAEEVVEEYVYQFPSDLNKKDLDELKDYNLRVIGRAEVTFLNETFKDYLIQGKKEDLERYCKEYLGYEMHPDYLWKESDCPYK